MERKTYKELVKEVDRRIESVFNKMNQSLENPDDTKLRIEVIQDIALNIEGNLQMIKLVQTLIEDNEKSNNIGLFTKLKNVYYLVKINNYYCATNDTLIEVAYEHGFAINKGGDKNE